MFTCIYHKIENAYLDNDKDDIFKAAKEQYKFQSDLKDFAYEALGIFLKMSHISNM